MVRIGVLLIGLGVLLLYQIVFNGRRATAVYAFTGVWLIAGLLLLANRESWEYLGGGAVVTILGAHVLFTTGHRVAVRLSGPRGSGRKRNGSRRRALALERGRLEGDCKVERRMERYARGNVDESGGVYRGANAPLHEWLASVVGCGHNASLPSETKMILKGTRSVFGLLAIAGGLGAILALRNTHMLAMLQTGEVAETRADLLSGVIKVPLYIRALSNAVYPLAVLGGICAANSSTRIKGAIYVLFTIFCLLGYSLSSGGKGVFLIGGLLMGWTIWASMAKARRRLGDLLKLGAIGGSAVVLCFAVTYSTSHGDESVSRILARYIYGPIVALSELDWTGYKSLAFKGDNNAMVREVERSMGKSVERTIDQTTVFVPFGFNVYTFLPELWDTYGYLGSIIYLVALGAVGGYCDARSGGVLMQGFRGCVYTYCTYTLFTDLFGLMVGWSLCVLTLAAVYCLAGVMLSEGNRRRIALSRIGVT